MVAALTTSPGTFSRMAVTDPPVQDTESSAMRKGRIIAGSAPVIKGIVSVTTRVPPRTGMIPTTVEMMEPTIITISVRGTKQAPTPLTKLCSKFI